MPIEGELFVMKSNAFEQLALFVTVALLTIPLLISCKKTSSSEEKQKENAALSNSSVQTEQLNEKMVGSKPRFPKKSCALYAGN